MRCIFFIISLLSITNFALACDCDGTPTIAESIKSSDVIVTGKVISILPDNKNGKQSTYLFEIIRLKVESVIKGDSTQVIEIKTAATTAMCGFPFKKGESYLVYGSSDKKANKKVYWVSFCDRTKSLSEAEEELQVLESLKALY